MSKLARGVSSPARTYVNQHFEAVKDEVRQQIAAHGDRLAELLIRFDATNAGRVASLSAQIARLEARVDELDAEIVALRGTNDQLLAVIAAGTERPESPA